MGRLGAIYRKAGWAEKLFFLLLATYLVVRWAAPASSLRLPVAIALTFTWVLVGLRLGRVFVPKAIWRLRNRLVVAYLFIAVVPIVLILLLAGIGGYILAGQISVYLVTSEIDRRSEALMAPAQGLLAAAPRDRADLIRWLTPFYEQRYPGLELLVRDRGEWRFPRNAAIVPPPAGHGSANGLILRDGHPYLWAHAVRGPAEALLMAPLTRALLASLAPNLGEVTLITGNTASARQARGGKSPPPANRFDIQIRWGAPVLMAAWEKPGQTPQGGVGIISRPSAVLRTLFSERMDWLGSWVTIFLVITSGVFLLVELAALVIGVSLTRTITGAVHNLYEGTRRVMEGDFSHHIEVRGNDQLADLGRSFNRMTENLERLLTVEKERERLQAELEIAREVQNQLYPKSVPSVRGLELVARCSPARTVSGDYYDYLGLLESGIALAIGDVAGKGISAALLMATLQSSLRTQIRGYLEAGSAGQRTLAAAFPASQLVSQLNQQLYAFTSAEKFATFYFGIYDDKTGLLTYTNAGHPPPIVIRDGEAVRLETNGTVVGAFPFSEYGESRIVLRSGDLLVCFTDGITEPENEYGEMFGEQRLTELLMKHSERSPAEIIETVFAAATQWTSSPEAQDDMTMLVARKV